MAHFENIQYEIKERIATITLNRPDKRNALNGAVVQELYAAFDSAAQDENVKLVVLTGKGKAFCAGADLAYLQQLQQFSYAENLQDSGQLAALFQKIYTFPKIVIARINGHALAGGCGLATVCDVAFAVETAQFGYTEVKIGFVPAIVSFFLLRKVGETIAKQLLISGELITAQQAKAYQLINEVVADEQALDQRIAEFTQVLCQNNSAQAMQTTKQLIREMFTLDLHTAMQLAVATNAKARQTADCQQGIAAFLNKELIKWS
jgi:methylglutaconyl-CoA hydratase